MTAKRSQKGKRDKPGRGEWLYGRQSVRETLRAGRRVFYGLYLAQGLKPSPLVSEVQTLARAKNIPLHRVERRQLDEWLGGVNHQGLALHTSPYPYAGLDQVLQLAHQRGEPPLILLLDRVQDPQNLGSLLRTAEACGVHGIVIPKHRAAGITPAVVNSSAGAVAHLLICQETNLTTTIERLKQEGIWVVGLEKDPRAQSLTASDLSGPLAVVVGSEGYGLGRLVSERCDWLVALPMVGQINSLNAAVAGSIVLYRILEQRLARLQDRSTKAAQSRPE
ncbi:MAG: 23S rRNA (guanosine(2251)-2'-O)-methyltransferase RlmB [Caldilineae bacterium]|nr:MAG: 23S rRNA (guanosine(2251)-2'-O)-methyltransferase RlmB [Caldilineae bacterium]